MTGELALAALGGVLIGLLLTVFGGGGSVLATPWLIYVVGVADAHVAIGTSAAAVAVNAATGLAVQARAGRVKWPCASVFGLVGLAGDPPQSGADRLCAAGGDRCCLYPLGKVATRSGKCPL